MPGHGQRLGLGGVEAGGAVGSRGTSDDGVRLLDGVPVGDEVDAGHRLVDDVADVVVSCRLALYRRRPPPVSGTPRQGQRKVHQTGAAALGVDQSVHLAGQRQELPEGAPKWVIRKMIAIASLRRESSIPSAVRRWDNGSTVAASSPIPPNAVE